MKKIAYGSKELLPPKSDVVFKAIFAADDNKDLLAKFLSDVLELDIESGSCIEILNSELVKRYDKDKKNILDLRVKTGNGEHIDVEIQIEDLGNIKPRSILYTAKLFTSQGLEAMDYSRLGRSIGLIIVDFVLFLGNEKWYNRFRLKNVESNEELTDLIELNYIELPKLKEQRESLESFSCKEKWALFLGAEDKETLDILEAEDEIIGKAVRKLVYISEDEKIRYMYDMEEKARMDYCSDMINAEKKGMASGLEKGMASGLEKGMASGIEKGTTEKALEDAKNLKKAGVDIKIISECVGLPIETIEKL